MAPRKIVLAQQKGGVGKTSLAVNLACQAVAHGQKAAVIDMDVEQGSAAEWGRRRKEAGLGEPVVYTAHTNELDGRIAKLQNIDWIFIDSPGRDAPASSAALRVADITIIPCRPVEDDIGPSFKAVKLISRSNGRYAYIMNIAPPQAGRIRARKVGEELKSAGHPVSPIIIVQTMSVPDANAHGMGVNEYKPGSESAEDFSRLFAWIQGELRR